MSGLTVEQKERMEQNRKRALEIRDARKKDAMQKLDNKHIKNGGTPNLDFRNNMFKGMKDSGNMKPNNNFYKSPSSSSNSEIRSVQNNEIVNPERKYITKNNGIPSQDYRSQKFNSSKSYSDIKPINNFYKSPSNSSGIKITGTFQLVSKDRFVVETGYHLQMIEIFKTMKSKLYDPKSKKWSFSLTDHNNLNSSLLSLRPEVCLSAIPTPVLKAIEKYRSCSMNVDLLQLDASLLEAFMAFQRKGVCFGISRKGRVLIADDMGLGKTLQALGIAAYYKHEWPLLIVTPSSVRYSWANSVERWVDVDMEEMAVVNTSKDSLYAKVVIVSYDLLARRSKEIQDIGFRVVIMDESHMLKNAKTARTKAALPIMKVASRIILLSGTPALSRPSELFSQVRGINPAIFPSHQDFGIRYCNGKQTPWGWDFTGSSNLDELQVVLENTVMIRRLKSEVIEQLPCKQRMTVRLNPSSITKSKAVSEAAEKFKSCSKSSEHTALLQFFSESAHAKLKAVSEYIKDLINDDKKFLVFAHHHVMLNQLANTCQEMKARFIRIDGSTPSENRQKLVDHFQTKDDTRVAILSITAASTGITLTAAQLVVFAELYWNPGVLVQAEDRVHRIGQQDSVLIQYLVAEGTADDNIWPMIQSKLNVLNKVGLSKANFSEASSTAQKTSTTGCITKYLVKSQKSPEKPDEESPEKPDEESPEKLDEDLIACFEDDELMEQ